MKYKAEYTGCSKDKYTDTVYLFYKYKGKEYMITDTHNGYSETLAEQHKREQAKIDKQIEEDKKKPLVPEPYNNEAEKAIEDFLKWCGI